MRKLDKEALFSPLGILIAYILVSGAAIMGFRLVFPGESAPLAHFSLSWRLIRGFLDYLGLFPALALSALVIPFGFQVRARETRDSFSPLFFKSLKFSIIAAIVAAALFGLLSSLALPLARDYEASLRFQGRLYRLARERAEAHSAGGEWTETAQFLAICERIWPEGPEVEKLRIEAGIQIEQGRISPMRLPRPEAEPWPGLADPRPVNASEALALAETALAGERYFDAHWLAELGARLAKPDSADLAAARRLAGRAWNGVNSLEPNAREARAYGVFRLKRAGYQAFLAEEWIEAYYAFLDLLAQNPEDPDVEKYLALSAERLNEEAFFIDEMEMALGRILTGAFFSLPQGSGRLAMRIASLSVSTDSAYGMGIEILAFDRDGLPLWRAEAPYAKILPLSRGAGAGVSVLMRALDRENRGKSWEPEFWGEEREPPAGAQIALELSWENFLLLSNIRRGLSGLSPAALAAAAENLENYGSPREIFEAELLRRFSEPLLLLPLGIFAIVIGWRYRARKRSRYMAIPMLGLLPLVFNGAIFFLRSWIDNLGIWATTALGFGAAAVFLGLGILLLLILSLIALAAQHG